MRRVSLSTLAFPPATRFVLVRDEADEGDAQGPTEAAFSATLSLANGSEIARVSGNPGALPESRISNKLYIEVRRRFARTYEFARESVGEKLTDLPSAHSFRRSKVWYDRGPNGVEVAHYADGPPSAGQMWALIQRGADRSFGLDNGVPFPTGEPSGLALMTSLPIRSGDPLQEVRAAAFAGWAISTQRSDEDVQENVRILSRTTR